MTLVLERHDQQHRAEQRHQHDTRDHLQAPGRVPEHRNHQERDDFERKEAEQRAQNARASSEPMRDSSPDASSAAVEAVFRELEETDRETIQLLGELGLRARVEGSTRISVVRRH